MSVSVKADPELWEDIKRELKNDNNGKWNARLSQQLTRRYKAEMEKRGKKPFVGPKRADNSLAKWTKQKWQYITPESKRYLPEKVIAGLSPSEKRILSRGKELGTRKAYPASVRSKILKKL